MTEDMARLQAPAREREVAQAVQALHQFPLHIHISSLFILLIVVVGSLIGGLGYKLGRDVLDAAQDVTARIHRETLAETGNLLAPPRAAVNAIRHVALPRLRAHAERIEAVAILRDVLLGSDALSSVYYGYADGDFFFMRRLRDAAERAAFASPHNAAYLVQSIDHVGEGAPGAIGRYVHLDAALNVLRADARPEYPSAYDPCQRGWFRAALGAPRRRRRHQPRRRHRRQRRRRAHTANVRHRPIAFAVVRCGFVRTAKASSALIRISRQRRMKHSKPIASSDDPVAIGRIVSAGPQDEDQGGFTLIEVVVALVIITVALLGIFATLRDQLTRAIIPGRRHLQFCHEVEQIRAAKFTPYSTDTTLTGGVKALKTVNSADGSAFNVQIIVDNNPFAANVQDETTPTSLKEVTITVTLASPTPGWQTSVPATVILRRVRGN